MLDTFDEVVSCNFHLKFVCGSKTDLTGTRTFLGTVTLFSWLF